VALLAVGAVALALVYVVAVGYASELATRAAEVASSRPALAVHQIDGVDQLRAGFNVEQDTPRLLLLFSPT
jgi:hypothetical protein